MKVDILIPTWNRYEFTVACVEAMRETTEWDLVNRVWCIDDDSSDGTAHYMEHFKWPVPRVCIRKRFGGPVAVMNAFIAQSEVLGDPPAPYFAKIDNDVLLPPGWLGVCMGVAPQVDLLGIECGCDNPVPANQDVERYVRKADHIGGIGVFKRSAFARTKPFPDGRMGFTAWQNQTPGIKAGWLDPPLPIALLDHLPFEPWRSLSEKYVRLGWQRTQWGFYEERSNKLWDWWHSGAREEAARC